MKAGLAVMLEVAEGAAARRREMAGELVLHFAIGEERAEPGTRSLLEAGFVAEVGIVVEPTLLRVATAGRGGAAIGIRIEGRSGHAGMPEAAANPIAALPFVLVALSEHEASLADSAHPLLPAASVTPTVIAAGETSNTIPATVAIVVDRRLLPGEELDADLAALARRLAAVDVPGIRVELDPPEYHWSASETPARSGFADLVREVAATAGCERAGEVLGTPYATDVGSLVNDGGVEAVVFGAGDVGFAHRPDERIDLAEVELAAASVEGVVERLLFPG
jgi:succinyl-diaminopimelate desuccinylase